MNSEIILKIYIYKTIGYPALLVASAIPLGMQVLNFALGNIKV